MPHKNIEDRRAYYAKRVQSDPAFVNRQRERLRNFYHSHKESESLRKSQFYLENRDAVLERCREYRAKNPNKNKELRASKPEVYKLKDSEYYLKNKDHIIARNAAYDAKRKMWDQGYKFATNLRGRIRSALKGKGIRSRVSLELLGCSVSEARSHIESQFKPGMSWDNWSMRGWHLDHKMPIASFDLTDPIQLSKACHYTNLQPLWASENLRKGKKIIANWSCWEDPPRGPHEPAESKEVSVEIGQEEVAA